MRTKLLSRPLGLLSLFVALHTGAALAAATGPATSGETAGEATAAGDQQMGKILWDIDLRATPGEFNVFIKAIRKTYDDLLQEGIEPNMVILFRGLAAHMSTSGSGSSWAPKIRQENLRLIGELQELPGVVMEADQEAIRGASDEAKRLLTKVSPVENVFLALIRYQSQGYHVITID
jgi:hypothetical protein